ncbi:MAG TPA: GEVED domain-containing protein, partial [Xanthomarina sp.]|nr:GEVED domain-containing protein [Xanthomarina sp.]
NDSSGGTQPPAAIDNISLEIPACPAPMDLATTNVNSDSVDISWTAGDSETAWNVSWGAPGYTPGVDDLGTDTASTTSYQIAGLTPQTSYDVYVQADCGNGDLSSWAGPLSFETACSAITEMFEDFDSYATGSIVPDCWERIVPATSAGSQTISSTSPASGTRNIYQYTSSTSNSVIVALPEFSNVNAGTHWLKLKARVASGSGALSVGYVTDVSDYNSFTLIEDVTITNTSYASNSEYTVVIPNTVPAGARLGIKSAANGTSHYWDDVTWEQAPSCLEPSSLEVTDLTSTTADIAWVANNSETSWNVSWGAPGYTPGDTEEISTAVASTNSYQIGGLSADSHYDVYVQANCGAVDGESNWAGPLSVYTGYCIPSGSSNNSDEIRNFTLNNLNNDSAASEGTNGYSDYTTSVAPAELQVGVPYTASLTSGTGSGNHGAAIWIDLDQNLVFDSSEMVAFLPSSIGANTTIDFPAFTLPSNLPLGTYRLRVQYHYNKSGDLLDPCVATSSFSETEDYTVEVSEATVSVDDYNMFSDTRLYPNPLNDNTFFVHAPKLNGEQVEVNITDMTGRQFYNNTFSVSDNRLTVSLNESLTSGVYLVTLKNGGDAHTFRLVKK